MTSSAIRRGMCLGGLVVADRLGVLIDYVCDAHVRPEPIGPLVTRYDGAWAYCAGYGASEHRWRRTAPLPRDLLERLSAGVDLICAGKRHLEHGLSVPDGHGILTAFGRKWAYCSAALDEPHEWAPVKPIEFRDIEHDRLAGMIEAAR